MYMIRFCSIIFLRPKTLDVLHRRIWSMGWSDDLASWIRYAGLFSRWFPYWLYVSVLYRTSPVFFYTWFTLLISFECIWWDTMVHMARQPSQVASSRTAHYSVSGSSPIGVLVRPTQPSTLKREENEYVPSGAESEIHCWDNCEDPSYGHASLHSCAIKNPEPLLYIFSV